MSKIILDTETTGLNPFFDEIIELAAIDADTGDIMINRRYGTIARTDWDDAEAINGISPADVAGLPPLGACKEDIEIINSADLIIGWNIDFDIRMIEATGVKIKPERFDMMSADAQMIGEITPDRQSGKWRKLVEAASWWGFDPQMAEQRYHVSEYHGALFDCAATRDIYRNYMIMMSATYNLDIKRKIMLCRNYMRSIQDDMHRIHLFMTMASLRDDRDAELKGMLDMLLSDLRTVAGYAAIGSGGLDGDQGD